MPGAFYVYMLANRPKGVLYIGATNNLLRRMAEHKSKQVPGFSKNFGVTRLVYFEEYASILEARIRERSLKRWRRTWKFELVETYNPDWIDLSDQLQI